MFGFVLGIAGAVLGMAYSFNTTIVWVRLMLLKQFIVNMVSFNTTIVWVRLTINQPKAIELGRFNTTIVWVRQSGTLV